MPDQSSASQTLYSSVRTAEAATGRSSLELLGLSYPFSQVSLLTASDFAKLAEERRGRSAPRFPPMHEQVLEELHRREVLVPLFRVDLTPRAGALGVDISASLTAKNVHATVINQLFWAAAEGRVIDPSVAGFEPWPKDRLRVLWPSVESGYVYSRHQLLSLDGAMSFVAELKPQREGHRLTWHLEDASMPNAPTLEALGSWRSLAVTLSALDTFYWPQITHMLSGELAIWRKAVDAFDPTQMLTWLGLSLDQIGRQIISLLGTASFRDDTGNFYELIRRAKADSWKSLRGDAAAAMDYRLAADILVQFAKELNPDGNYADSQHTSLSQQALSARPGSLDAALTDLRLSPFPALVVGVEGATEYLLVPRVMDLLGIRWGHDRIKIVDFGGTDADLQVLARYAVEPVLGRDYGRGVVLDRPLTRFMVMVDAEKKYRTAECRRYQRKLLLDSLTRNVPKDLRADYYTNTTRGRIVDIRTWGKLPFEFAHFKDSELADAMLSTARVPHPQGRAQLINNLHMQRTHDPEPNVEKVFWRGARLDKVPLADALWPVLEAKINDAIQLGKPGPPVMQACVRAYEMAAVSQGVPIILRRRRWRPRK